MSEFVYWEVSREAESCYEETLFFFQKLENALAFAKELVLKIQPRFPHSTRKLLHTDENESLGMLLGVPEIVVDEWRVSAVYPTIIALTRRDKVVLQPEIKEAGKPYQPAQIEERTNVRELGTLYVEHSSYGPDEFFLNEKSSNFFLRKREEWKASASVFVTRKVIETKD